MQTQLPRVTHCATIHDVLYYCSAVACGHCHRQRDKYASMDIVKSQSHHQIVFVFV